MIRRPNNWNEVKEFTERPKLPLGAYVCQVKKAVVQSNAFGDQLCLVFDIAEGDFKGYYDDDFKSNTNENKKWKGVFRQWLPKDNGTEQDEWTKSAFKGMLSAFEKSNPGYQWNWEETSLTGKFIGILYRNEEWEYDGKSGWAVRPFRAIDIELVKSQDYTLPKDKPLKNKAVTDSFGMNMGFEVTADDEDLPF